MPAAKPKIQKTCPTCKIVFLVKPSVADIRRCCSVKCQGLWKRSTRTNISCGTCKKDFSVRPSDIKFGRKFCSRDCAKLMYSKIFKGNKHRVGKQPWNKGLAGFMAGINNPNWKGGSGTKRHQAMGKLEYRNWRKFVFERDNYTCQDCTATSTYLHADHIIGWSENETLRYDVDNGQTLCYKCHYKKTFKKIDEDKALLWGVPRKYRSIK